MKIDEFTTGLRFLNAKNVPAGALVIANAEKMDINAKPRLVLTFSNDPRGFALTPEQVSTLAAGFGSNDTDDWKGKQLKLAKGPKSRGIVIDSIGQAEE